jgi:ParB-like chromosome segregation protein Spo0J
MKIEKLGIEKIRPYENNAKLHPRSQIEQIKKSIQEFGNNDPIAIDENDVIIEGHGRYFALKELGYENAEIIRLSHLSEEQKRAYILVHNKLTLNTGFDFEKLNFELEEIKSIDMSEFDFEINFDTDKDFKEPKNSTKEVETEEKDLTTYLFIF